MSKVTALKWLRALRVFFQELSWQHNSDKILLQFYPEGGSYGVAAVSKWEIYKQLERLTKAVKQADDKIPDNLRIDLMTWYTAMHNPVERSNE